MFQLIRQFLSEIQRRERLIEPRLRWVLRTFTFLILSIWLVEFGFFVSEPFLKIFDVIAELILGVFILGNALRVIYLNRTLSNQYWRALVPLIFAAVTTLLRFWGVPEGFSGLEGPETLEEVFLRDVPILLFILFELAQSDLKFYSLSLNPATIFIISFLLLIFFGTLLLFLPRATTVNLSLLDTVFTSTSAVCVTGLIVTDTATSFTSFGKGLLLILIQIGGLGVITFTYFFTYFFQGSASLKSTIYMKNMVSAENLGSTLRIILRIVVITLSVEAVGAIALWFMLEPTMFNGGLHHIGFSVFHSISAFCNAGFSTMSNGLAEMDVQFNYAFQSVIMLLILVGGIGFATFTQIGELLWYYIRESFRKYILRNRWRHRPTTLSINAVLAVRTSLVLLLIGFVTYLFFEFDHTLTQHDTWYGKAVTALFAAVTPRTAGFNTVNMTDISLPMLIVTIGLMWVGASTGSTGGGIKTSTIGIAFLNIASVARGRHRIEFRNREITRDSVDRAFSIIIMSLVLIIGASTLLTYTDPDIPAYKLFFEVFSATSTVGLTLDVTSNLSDSGKIIIIVCMFVGRVGTLTVVTALARKVVTMSYAYPKQEVLVG